ncbi:MAG: SWIM zinc finger family protein [Betaproteobacteria bacterium]|nr:SWIM zinc finger family protein [Betaproteobacteria bacterium]
MPFSRWKPYVSVAKRREQANRAVQKAKKSGKAFAPIVLTTRGAIAKTFWGKAWCDNLEAYSDYENRLPRGRTYVRNGSVIDLQIEPGKVVAQVMGSSLYRIEIGISALPAAQWEAIVRACTGSIASLVELLQGKFSKAVMERVCQPKTGLFPSPQEIQLDCSCPDWATMCKHIAAVLYGVGARLDEKPELLFTLRQVDAGDLVTQVAEFSATTTRKKAPAKSRILDDTALSDVFGIDLGEALAAATAKPKKPRSSAGKAAAPKPAVAAKTPTVKASRAARSPQATARKSTKKRAASADSTKSPTAIDATLASTPQTTGARTKAANKR